MTKANDLEAVLNNLRELGDSAAKKSQGFKNKRFKGAKNYWQGVEHGYTVAIGMLAALGRPVGEEGKGSE